MLIGMLSVTCFDVLYILEPVVACMVIYGVGFSVACSIVIGMRGLR